MPGEKIDAVRRDAELDDLVRHEEIGCVHPVSPKPNSWIAAARLAAFAWTRRTKRSCRPAPRAPVKLKEVGASNENHELNAVERSNCKNSF